jgi:hypothetical protein
MVGFSSSQIALLVKKNTEVTERAFQLGAAGKYRQTVDYASVEEHHRSLTAR